MGVGPRLSSPPGARSCLYPWLRSSLIVGGGSRNLPRAMRRPGLRPEKQCRQSSVLFEGAGRAVTSASLPIPCCRLISGSSTSSQPSLLCTSAGRSLHSVAMLRDGHRRSRSPPAALVRECPARCYEFSVTNRCCKFSRPGYSHVVYDAGHVSLANY
jgi:hypothetical protein